MEENKFYQMFLFSLMNLICFLLTTIFLTTLYNIKSQTILLQLPERLKDSYENSFTALAVLFTFAFFGFGVFMFVIMVLIKKMKVNKVEYQRYSVRENLNQKPIEDQDNNNNDVSTTARLNVNYNKGNYVIQTASKVDIEGGKLTLSFLEKLMIFLFIYCQIIYLIEIIVLTAYYIKSKNLEKDFDSTYSFKGRGEYFTKRYRDLIIVGYIFFVIFLFFDLFAFVNITKCGIRPETIKEREEEENKLNKRYCDFCGCSEKIEKACNYMATTFKNCIKTSDDIRNEIADLEKKAKDLEEYKEKVESINNKLMQKKNITFDDLEKLGLPTSGGTKTKIITIKPS